MNKFIIRIIVGCLYSINALSYAQPMENQPVTLQNLLTLQPEDMSNIMSNGGALTITGSGTIHFLQAFFYSDSSCTTLLGVASAIDNTSGITFTNGATVTVNSSSVYQLANNQGITTGNIACMKLYVDGGNESSNGVSCQSFTDETCSGSTCTSSQTKSIGWGTSPTACATRYAYIGNIGGGVSKCTVDSSTGALSSCASTGSGFDGPTYTATNNSYLYAANAYNSTTSKCAISSADGSLSNCSTTGSGFNGAQGVTPNNSYTYISNTNTTSISQCTVSASTGALSACGTTGSFSGPSGGLSISSSGYGYVANQGSSSVTKCTLNPSTGALSSCSSTGSGFNACYQVTLNNGYAYIANFGNSTVSQCTVNSLDGSLSDCATTGSGFNGPVGIGFNNGYAYVVNYNIGAVVQCTVSGLDGTFSACTATSGFAAPFGISFY
jgi:hypothetical protein